MATAKPSNETNSANKIDYILKFCVENNWQCRLTLVIINLNEQYITMIINR